jgi:hypothetical protein
MLILLANSDSGFDGVGKVRRMTKIEQKILPCPSAPLLSHLPSPSDAKIRLFRLYDPTFPTDKDIGGEA